MNGLQKTLLSAATLFAATLSSHAQGDWTSSWDEPYTVQALLGVMQFDDFTFTHEGTPAETNFDLIPELGGAWATLPKGDKLQYGLECSFLLGFKADSVSGGFVNGVTYVRIEGSMWMFDLAGGGYINYMLGDAARIYAGAGPLIMYIDYNSDKYTDDTTNPDPEVKESSSSTSFSVGAYARTGIEFRIHDQGYLGLGARGTWSGVDFSDVGGPNGLAGIAGFISYTVGLNGF